MTRRRRQCRPRNECQLRNQRCCDRRLSHDMRQECVMRCQLPLSLVCLAGLLSWGAGCDKAAARAEPPPPKVSVAHPEVREVVDYDNYNGWLDAANTVEVRARVRGHIQKIHFSDG